MTDTDIANGLAPDNDTPADDWPAADAPTPTHHRDPSADVRADRVEISQGGANNVTAKSVSISQGGAGRVSADQITISQGGVGVARATSLTLNDRAGAFGVVADEATLNGNASAFLLVARQVSGSGRVIVDWRAAAAFGAAFAVVLSLLRRGR